MGSLKGIRLITFDVTNTLLRFKVPPWQYYMCVAKDYGFKGTEDEVKAKLKSNMKVMLEKHPNFGKSTILWENWWAQVVKMTLQDHLPTNVNLNHIASKLINEYKTSRCWSITNGGEKLLDYLIKAQFNLGVISNFDPRLYNVLEDVGLDKKFDFIITSYETGYSKPDERIFNLAINKLNGVKPHQALHIGDDVEKDYEGARAAGWNAILISESLKAKTLPTSRNVFKSLEDLYKAIEQNKLKL